MHGKLKKLCVPVEFCQQLSGLQGLLQSQQKPGLYQAAMAVSSSLGVCLAAPAEALPEASAGSCHLLKALPLGHGK